MMLDEEDRRPIVIKNMYYQKVLVLGNWWRNIQL